MKFEARKAKNRMIAYRVFLYINTILMAIGVFLSFYLVITNIDKTELRLFIDNWQFYVSYIFVLLAEIVAANRYETWKQQYYYLTKSYIDYEPYRKKVNKEESNNESKNK